MANEEHLKILRQGVGAWNHWRKKKDDELPDFSKAVLVKADFSGAILIGANFSSADLSGADFRSAHLTAANFSSADLSGAHFRSANLQGVNFSDANLQDANISNAFIQVGYFKNADLRGADLRGADLECAILIKADLSGADLRIASLIDADLRGADLSGADLMHANLYRAKLSDANLRHASLIKANLSETHHRDTDFKNTTLEFTVFYNTNLNGAKNLETCKHLNGSNIDQTTLIKSGKLPEKFLRGCGLSDEFIAQIPFLFWEKQAFEFYSCFISYSSKDEAFAKRLHADLQDNGVRCWFAPEDLKIGDKFRSVIDDSIRVYDKLLLIFSENSLNSTWVENEVESAFEKEEKTKGTVLFPIRLDAAVMDTGAAWAKTIKRTRHIGDFTRWKEHDAYQTAFQRLLRDLKGEVNNGE